MQRLFMYRRAHFPITPVTDRVWMELVSRQPCRPLMGILWSDLPNLRHRRSDNGYTSREIFQMLCHKTPAETKLFGSKRGAALQHGDQTLSFTGSGSPAAGCHISQCLEKGVGHSDESTVWRWLRVERIRQPVGCSEALSWRHVCVTIDFGALSGWIYPNEILSPGIYRRGKKL